MPDLTVIIPTYNRPEILMNTVAALRHHLKGSRFVDILIGDDGDDTERLAFYFSKEAAMRLGTPMAQVIHGPKRGLGANLNMLLKATKTDIVLQIDDDHQLTEDLDISYHLNTLAHPPYNLPRIGWIRLYMGQKRDYDNWMTYYKFLGRTIGPYWWLYPSHGELYVASNRPHLKLVSMHTEHYGWYPEDVKLGETETAFCHQYAERYTEDKPGIVVPMFLQECWDHVTGEGSEHQGQSWQKEGL